MALADRHTIHSFDHVAINESVLVGHSLGLRGVYTDATALPLREAVSSIPPMGGAGRVMRLVGRKQTTRTHSVPGVSRRHTNPK